MPDATFYLIAKQVVFAAVERFMCDICRRTSSSRLSLWLRGTWLQMKGWKPWLLNLRTSSISQGISLRNHNLAIGAG